MNAQELYNEMSSKTQEYFECQLPILNETPKAICFDAYRGELDKEKPVWLPKSQMVIVPADGDFDTRYFVKNWLYPKTQ